MPNLTEAKTRARLINPQLERAGWNLSDRSQVRFEVPVVYLTGYGRFVAALNPAPVAIAQISSDSK